jgi:flavin-dependent dehydrogenase
MSRASIPARADVVVIGGGPAGSTAANLLAQRGYDIVLLDKARHPRPTVGESLIPHFWKYSDELGATDDIERAQFIKKSGGTGIWRGEIFQLKLTDFGHIRPPLHVERDEFDHILLNVARRKGVQVLEEVLVRRAMFDGDRAVGVAYLVNGSGEQGEISCRYVVDASGQAAVIARQLGFREFDQDLRFLSVWGYFENSDYVAQKGTVCPWTMRREVRPTTLQAGIGDWSWCWHIVQKEATSVGLVLAPEQQAAFKTGGADLEERFLNACLNVPYVGQLLRSARLIPGSLYAIRDFAYRPRRLAGDGWFLAGDAAAFVDPVNSAGVLTAFYMGAFAAQCVEHSLVDSSRAPHYQQFYGDLVRRRMALFGISARPPGHNSYPEDYPLALQAARADSVAEQELIAAQNRITGRPENLAPLQALDGRLHFGDTGKCVQVPGITFPSAASQEVV